MVICVPVATLYSEPQLMSQQVDEALYGEEAEVLEEQGGFVKIKTEYNYIGWTVKTNLFEKLHDANHIITVPFADLLFENRNYFHAPFTLPRGARVDCGFSDSEKRYSFAVLPSKRIYYLHKSHIAPLAFIKKSNEAEIRDSLVATATEYLGVQYRWGGRTHRGIDCSGLCFNAYRFNGLSIWRDADIDRSECLKRIPLTDIKNGDLLFFKGHVAMYVGDGNIIHASASAGKVLIEKFEENEHLKSIFECAGTAF